MRCRQVYRLFTCFVLSLGLQTAHGAASMPGESATDINTREQLNPDMNKSDLNEQGLRGFPLMQIYPRYIADPYRTTFAAKYLRMNRSDVPASGEHYISLRLGGALPLAQYNWSTIKSQLVLEGGFHGLFDQDQSADNLGWEGIYALYLALRISDTLAMRAGYRHFSSHVGDEYAEQSGRVRINYTREEMRGGVNWQALQDLQLYYDLGYAFTLRNKSKQKHWRHQFGLQYECPDAFFDSTIGWYAAADVSVYEENDYSTNTTLQLGLVVPRLHREWRFFVEYYNGRTQLGEFFENKESYYGAGFTIDI